MNSPSSSIGATVQAPRHSPARSSDEGLLHPPGPKVEQVEEVGGEQQQREIGEVVEVLPPAPGHRVGGQGQGAHRLDRAGREAAVQDRPGVPSPPAGRIGRRAPAEGVVEKAEQRDADDVGRPPAELGIQQVEIGPVVEHREWGQRHQRAGDQHSSGRESGSDAAVVLAHQARMHHVVEPAAGEQRRHRRGGEQPGDHGAGAGGRASSGGTSSSASSPTPKFPCAPRSA